MADATTAAVAAAEKTVSTPAAKAALNRAAKEAVSVAVSEQALPLIAETTELALEVPSKVVLNQKVVFVVGVVGGAILGASALYGAHKLRERRLKAKVEKAVEETLESVKPATTNTNKGNKPA